VKNKYLIIVLGLICVFLIVSFKKQTRDQYSKENNKPPTGTLISEEQVENIKHKFKMVKIDNFFEDGIDNLESKEKEKASTFTSGAVRVYVGYNDKGEHLKLIIDPNNNKNPEDTAFIIKLD